MNSLAGSGLESPMRLQSRCQPGLCQTEGLTGAGGSASRGLPRMAGHWQEMPPCLALGASPKDCLSVLMRWQLVSPRTSDPKKSKAEATLSFRKWPWKSNTVTSALLLATQVSPVQCSRGLQESTNIRRDHQRPS